MSIQSKISDGFAAVAASSRSLRSVITGSNTGNISGLITTTKANIVAAINEMKSAQLDGSARSSMGGRYSFSLAAQPRRSWIQPTTLTTVYSNMPGVVALASGNFTFSAGTVANVARNWIFFMQVEAISQDDIDTACEIRVNGNTIARSAVGGMFTGSGVFTRAYISTVYKLSGNEVVTFHGYHNRLPPLLTASTSDMSGIIGMAPL